MKKFIAIYIIAIEILGRTFDKEGSVLKCLVTNNK